MPHACRVEMLNTELPEDRASDRKLWAVTA